jgi:hypothetical protein
MQIDRLDAIGLDDPLRIQPDGRAGRFEQGPAVSGAQPSAHHPEDELSEVSIPGDDPSAPEYALPALGLGQPAGISDRPSLDAEDLGGEEDPPPPPPVIEAPRVPSHPDGAPDMPDTRITQVRTPARRSSRGLLMLVAIAVVAIAIVLVSRREVGAPVVERPPPPAPAPVSPPPAARPIPRNRVTIDSTPRGADVLYVSEDRDVEPLKLGVTPFEFQLPDLASRQKLRVLLDGHRPAEVVVTPENPRIHVHLER